MNNNMHDPLDDIKKLWQQDLDRKTEEAPLFQAAHLNTVMKQQTSVVKRLKRKLLIEIVATLPLAVAMYYLFESRNHQLSLSTWVTILLLAFGYHVYLYLKLESRDTLTDTPLLPTVQANVKRLRVLLVIYKVTSVLMGLIFFFTTSLFTYFHAKNDLLLLIGLSFINGFGAIGGYVVGVWYAHKLYLKPYQELLECEQALH